MNRKSISCLLLIAMIALVLAAACSKTERIGHWRVETGPAGNEFYQPPVSSDNIQPPSKQLLEIVTAIAPDYTEIRRWEQLKDDLYFIRAEAGPEEYDFEIATDGTIYELEYENDSTNVSEKPDELMIKDTKKSVDSQEIPETMLKTLNVVLSNNSPDSVWIASTINGKRFVVAVNGTVYYGRTDGQIRAIGLIERGALNEIELEDFVKPSDEEILAEAHEVLSSYRDRLNFQNQIEQLGKQPVNKDGSFRFVVIGDSRSNQDLWFNIVKHIDQLDPKPAFIINTGDIVRHGYTKEYQNYYVPAVLQTDIPLFVAIGNHDDGDNSLALEYRHLFGENTLNYAFDYGTIRFIQVDNVTAVQSSEETLAQLQKNLASTPAGYKIIVSAHKPITNVEKWAYHAWASEESDAFARLMTEYEVEHVFFGHIHAYSTATYNDVPYTICGGGGAGLHNRFGPTGNVHHYVICDVAENGRITQQVVRFYEEQGT